MHLLIDKTGQFRGMAFVTFDTEEAATIFSEKVTGVEVSLHGAAKAARDRSTHAKQS